MTMRCVGGHTGLSRTSGMEGPCNEVDEVDGAVIRDTQIP